MPERVTIPTRLLVRQSCGCPAPSLVRAGLDPPSPALKERASGLPLLASEELGEALTPQWYDRVQAAFLAELSGEAPGQFLAALADEVRQATWAGDEASRWNNVISGLRHSVLAGHAAEEERRQAERLCHQARVLIGETAQLGQAYQTLQGEDKLRTLSQINQNLSITTSLEELVQVLVNTLRLLHIPLCYLALYEDPHEPASWSRLIMAYDEMGNYELEAGGVRFPSRQVIPDGFLPAGRRYSLVVEPLYFKEDQLGFVLFEADPYEDEIYEILAGQISGALKRTVLIERNIRLYTEAVEARKSAEEANLLKSRFLSMVSHELRTPLSLIVGTIEMMLQEERASGTPPLPETYRQDMDCAHTAAQHLFRLIGDVLDLASSQAGELRLACEPLNLGRVLHEVALLGESLAREKDLGWHAAIPQRLPVVWGDRTRLRQVTLNLVSNAVKFTERGRVELGVQVGEQDVTVTVSDTGMGIPLEEQVTIFDEFRRSERSLRRGYGGIGLGLAISRRLVELHGGVIGVRSSGEEESGSTFYFKLPVQAAPQPDEDAAPPSRSVLLLAERAERARTLRDHLVRRGYEVEVLGLEETSDWLPRVTAAPPGAIVLDYQPAAEQGWEMIQLLKQSSTTRDIPVIFYSYFQERERGSLLEMDYLTKPLRQAELLQALDRLGLCDEKDLRTILVVDDEPAILDMHTRLLQGHLPDCHILGARDGQEALSVIEQTMPDLVLLDLMMPEMDGFQVLEAMRDRELSRHIPVIVLTAQLLTRLDMARLQRGVAAVLAKGVFSGEEVLAQVEAALARNKRLGSEAQRILRQAMAYINEHYAQPISRKDLASQLAVSDNYLTRCFRQELGITPTAYVNRRRVQQAKAIFQQQGQTTVTEVALAVGFSDSNYFARVFRKEEGVTPSAYAQGKRPGA